MENIELIEKKIIILESVKLTHLSKPSVAKMFKVCYDYLIDIENYEKCAELKVIEDNYKQHI